MLTIAYVRVSTEDQVDYSPDAQRNRALQLAQSRDLGAVRFISDDGISGKDLNRPGVQELIELVERDLVAHVIVWRLDRLSRDNGDLSRLIRMFDRHCVSLHSVTEGDVDVNSASGRMQVGIHGVFAQYYREALVENVRLGMAEAASQGRWLNRAPTGYDMVNGFLVPNGDAAIVQRIFELRAQGKSYPEIETATGIKYSTVRHVCHNRVYLGDTRLGDEWFPGVHDALITPELFEQAQRGNSTGRRLSRDILSGHVRCTLCTRAMTVAHNAHTTLYRCKHRGTGCSIPGRSASGLHRATRIALNVLATDTALQQAIRTELNRTLAPRAATAKPRRLGALSTLRAKRKKLLDLYYADQISATTFADEERSITTQIEALEAETQRETEESTQRGHLAQRFEDVAQLLRQMNIEQIWSAATEQELRALVDELIEAVYVHDDHLQVEVRGAPPIKVTLQEAGLQVNRGSRPVVSEGVLCLRTYRTHVARHRGHIVGGCRKLVW